MDHKEDRMKDKESWVRSEFIVNFIQMYLGLENVFSEKVIQQCIGIVNVNGIKSKLVMPGRKEKSRGQFEAGYFRCVYPTMALFSNCCDCNARCIHHGDFGKSLNIK